MAVMADKVPYTFATSSDILDYMVERMLYRFHDENLADDPLNQKIEKVYKEKYGCDMLRGQAVENVCLHGMPGVGKTSAVRAAAKEVAKLLGMNFVSNPVPPYVPGDNDLVISTLEMSGEVSNIVMGGIPVSDKLSTADLSDPIQYMNKLPLYQLAIMSRARAPVLLLDDFANAAPPVQNSALSIALEGRFQMLDLGRPFVAMTANLGALDNSDVSPLSDPMTGRIGHFYVEDELDDFAVRARQRYQDDLGDANVIGFLMNNESSFMMATDSEFRAPVNGVRTPYPSPRTWDKLMNEMRIYLNRAVNSNKKEDFSIKKIVDLASAFVGKKVGTDFGSYVYEVINGAQLISSQLISKDEFMSDMFEKKYGKGVASDEQKFGLQLAFSLSSHASAAVIRDPSRLEEVTARMAKGLMRLDDNAIMMSLNDYASRLSYSNKEKLVEKGLSGKPMLSADTVTSILKKLVEVGSQVGNPADQDFAKSMAETISGVSVYKTTYNSRKKAPATR